MVTEVGHAHDEAEHGVLHHHFDDMDQQRECNTLGMWCFLATELMMFGGLFFAYTLYRLYFFNAFEFGSHHLNVTLGTINTAVLLVSSLTMALAVHAASTRHKGAMLFFLVATFILGATFLVVKGFEWTADYREGLVPGMNFSYFHEHPSEATGMMASGVTPARLMMYFVLYFSMTGLHAIHMIVGLGIVGTLIYLGAKGQFTSGNDQPVEISGLYWHLIDIIWVFLFPLLYLIGGLHGGGAP